MNKYLITVAGLLLSSIFSHAQIITTIAGIGISGYFGDGGPATAAKINNVAYVIPDNRGNIYISDYGNNRVRKINNSGIITTFAGNGILGFSGDLGAATAAEFRNPASLAVDGIGNVYISDYGNWRIRKVDTNGIITTVAGNGTSGNSGDGGPATAAAIITSGLTIDGSGNIYIADYANNIVRRINSAGVINRFVGNGISGFSGDGGAATSARLNNPEGLAVDASGNLYITDFNNRRVRKVNSSGIINSIAGIGTGGSSGDGGPATSAELNGPQGIAVDVNGNIYVSDVYNNNIRKINSAGIITTFAGTGVGGFNGDGINATSAHLYIPFSVTVDGNGIVYINDQYNHRIRRVGLPLILGSSSVCVGASITVSNPTTGGIWTSSNTAIATIGSSTGLVMGISAGIDTIVYTVGGMSTTTILTVNPLPNAGIISGSSSVSVGSTITLADTVAGGVWNSSNPAIATVGSTGIVTGVSAGIDTISYSLTNICGTALATIGITVNALISGGSCNAITTFAGNGTMGYSGDGGAATSGMLSQPAGVAIDNNGTVYIADQFNNCIRKVDTSGVITTFAGTGIAGFSGDGGAATAAQLDFPHALVVDANGNLIIADEYNFRIRKVSTTGIISTIAGTGSAGYSGDGGPATSATFLHVHQIAIDNSGNIFFADRINNNIRKISIGGIISTVAGDGTHDFYGDGGPATAAAMKWPTGVAVDGGGNLYIADWRNQRIRFVNSAGIISTIAGTGTPGYSGDGGPATAASVTPNSVTVDAAGNLYIADGSSTIKQIDISGIITTVAGIYGSPGYSGDGGPATAAELSTPYYIDIDILGNLYVADVDNNAIRKVVLPLSARSILGSSSVSVGSAITLSITAGGGTWSSSNPSIAIVGSTGIAVGVSVGIDTISYSVTNACGTVAATKIVTVTASVGTACNVITTIAGNGTAGYSGDGGAATTATLNTYGGSVVADGSGNIYISDQNNHRIRKINSSGIISTFAGNGSAGFSGDGGTATAAELHYPAGIALDGMDNLYIVDEYNQRIRKVSSSGIITTIAGNGTMGYTGEGIATAVRLFYPSGVATDATGNVYIADAGNQRIRKVNTSGIISTIAGTGTSGYTGEGVATAVGLFQPNDVAVDASGNIYIGDQGNQRIRKVNTSGIISTIAGNGVMGYSGEGVATAVALNDPNRIAVTPSGEVFISDQSNYRIRKVDFSGSISTIAGNGTSGFSGDGSNATSAQLGEPAGIAVDAVGNVYINDQLNYRIRKITPGSMLGTITGLSSVSVSSTITLSITTSGGTWSSSHPAIATVGSTGIVTGVSPGIDTISYTITNVCGSAVAIKIVTVTASVGSLCNIITTIAGNGTLGYSGDGGVATSAQMHYPYSVCRDVIGNIYISDANNNRIRKVNTSGLITTIAGTGIAGFSGDGGPATAAQLNTPAGINIDNSGNLYIADRLNQRVRKISATGTITTFAGNGTSGFSGDGGPATVAQLNNEWSIAVDGAGNVYVTGNGNHRVRKINTSGIISTFAGNGSVGSTGDGGPATAAQLSSPNIRTVDLAGNLYITEAGGNRVRRINSSGTINTIAGTGTPGYSGDGGPATAAQLNFPNGGGVADASGNVYFADQQNNRVRKIDASGIITTVAGNGTAAYTGDGGLPTSAALNNPIDVIVDTLGNLFIVDHGNHVVRKILPTMLSVSAISGPSIVCVGNTIALTDSVPSGTWSSSNTAVATIGSITGIVTGVSSGVATISYTVTNACSTASATKSVTVTASPGAISGPSSVCTAATIGLANATPGGVWSSSNTAIATVASASGTVTGVAPGSVVVTYSLGGGCQATTTVNVLSLPVVPPITGSTSVCIGSTTVLGNPMSGGFWYSTDISIATVSSSGLVTGISGGVVAIVYAAANSCGIGFNSVFVTVNATSPITGPSTLCVGASAALFNSTSGGTWTSSNPAVVSIGSSSGIVSGLSTGSASITYALGPGCYSVRSMTVNSSSAAIIGASTLCVSLSATLTGLPAGGTWSSSNLSVATIGSSTGTVVGLAAGVTNITYSPGSGCYAVRALTVSTSAGPITGTAGVCTGSTTTLTPPSTGGVWSSASTFFATVGSSTGVVYGASPGTSVITYSIGPGCTSSITVTVRPLPAIIPVTGGGTICAGAPGINVGMPGSAVGINYQLYRGGVPVGAPLPGTGTSLSFGLQNIAGVYTVRAADPVTLCEANMSGGATITVFPLPTVGVSPGVAICNGASTTLTASGGVTYTWSPPTGLSSTVGSIVTALPSTTTTYTVTGTSSFGCTGTATVTVTVNALPTISAGPGVSICNGGSTILTASGGISYTWSSATGLSSTTGASVSASPSTTRTYTVTGTNSNGCANRATVTVTVNVLPTISAGSGRSICNGSSTTLTASGGVSYTWSPPAGLAATTGVSVAASPTVTTTYTVTGTSGSGCSNSATVAVTVNPLPAISATSGGAICNGSSTTLTASGGISYAWTPPTGLSATTGASVTTSPSVTTTYTVTGTNANGCSNTATITATVNPSPSAISPTGNLCVGNSVTLTNSTPGGTWISSNPTIATIGSSTGIVAGLATGTTTISYTLSSGCRATMVVTVAASPSTISGPGTIYTGSTATYTNATPGGVWSSSNTAIASIGSTSGIATGVAVGSATITYTVFSGCRATLLVSVSATPTVFSVTGGGVYCTGGAAVIIGLSGSQVGVSYQLYRGGTPVGSPVAGTGGAFSFGTFTTAGTYTVIANPSGSSPVTMTGSAIVTVIPSTMVPAPVPVTGGGTICAGAPGTAVGLSSGSAVTVNYQLYRNGILAGSPVPGTGTSLSFGLQTVAGVYTVIGTSTVNGCASNMLGGASITVYPTPNVYTVTGGGSYCAGGSGVVVGLNNSQSGVNYRLYNGTSLISTRPGTGAAITFGFVTAAGSYTVMGASTTCSVAMAGTATVSINPIPTISCSTYLVAPADTITLTGTPSGGSWISSTPSVATIGSSTGIVTGVSLGSSTISYTLPTGCRGTRIIYVTPTGHRFGNEDTTVVAIPNRNISVHPNPNKGTFIIKSTMGLVADEQVTIEITNMLGQLVYKNQVTQQNGILEEEVILTNVANGMYILNVRWSSEVKIFYVVLGQ